MHYVHIQQIKKKYYVPAMATFRIGHLEECSMASASKEFPGIRDIIKKCSIGSVEKVIIELGTRGRSSITQKEITQER